MNQRPGLSVGARAALAGYVLGLVVGVFVAALLHLTL